VTLAAAERSRNEGEHSRMRRAAAERLDQMERDAPRWITSRGHADDGGCCGGTDGGGAPEQRRSGECARGEVQNALSSSTKLPVG
jgi:hypothetical protein